jgi:hypothetical protein
MTETSHARQGPPYSRAADTRFSRRPRPLGGDCVTNMSLGRDYFTWRTLELISARDPQITIRAAQAHTSDPLTAGHTVGVIGSAAKLVNRNPDPAALRFLPHCGFLPTRQHCLAPYMASRSRSATVRGDARSMLYGRRSIYRMLRILPSSLGRSQRNLTVALVRPFRADSAAMTHWFAGRTTLLFPPGNRLSGGPGRR